jgi:valyl-tRNA synthetase
VNAAGAYTYTVVRPAVPTRRRSRGSRDPLVTAGADNATTICSGTTVDLNTLLSGADPGGLWSAGPVVGASGVYTYTVANACNSDVASFTVNVTSAPTAGSDASTTICSGSSIDLNTLLSGADPGGSWSAGPVVSAAGAYTYTVNTPCGSDAATFTIAVTPLLSAGADNAATICSGTTVDLNTLLSGADPGGSWSAGPVVSTSGVYTYTVTNACSNDVSSFTVNVTSTPTAGSDASTSICGGTSIDLNTLLSGADPGGSWSSGPIVSAAGAYTYTVNTACGSDAATFTIAVTPLLSAGADNAATICGASTGWDLNTLPVHGAPIPAASWSGGPVVGARPRGRLSTVAVACRRCLVVHCERHQHTHGWKLTRTPMHLQRHLDRFNTPLQRRRSRLARGAPVRW